MIPASPVFPVAENHAVKVDTNHPPIKNPKIKNVMRKNANEGLYIGIFNP